MVAEIESRPLPDPKLFLADKRKVWTAESCLRRGLEALLDTRRYILAKGFAVGVSEYKADRVRRCVGAVGGCPAAGRARSVD